MFNELLDNYRKKMVIPYYDNEGNLKEQICFIKPLSLNDIMYIMDDELCSYLLAKLIDGIEIKTKEGIEQSVLKTIVNADYIRLFYAILGCCITFNKEDGKGWYTLRYNPENVELLPLEIQVEILNNVLELSIPVDLNKFIDQVKKLQARLNPTK